MHKASFLLLFALTFLLLPLGAHADTIVTVNAAGIRDGFSDSVTLEMQLDLTTLTVQSYSASVTLAPTSLNGQPWTPQYTAPLTLLPLFKGDASICNPFCSGFSSPTVAIFNFYTTLNVAGAAGGGPWQSYLVQLGDYDYTYSYYCGAFGKPRTCLDFPQPGTWDSNLVGLGPNGMYFAGSGGNVVVSDPPDSSAPAAPELPTAALFLCGAIAGSLLYRGQKVAVRKWLA